MFIRQQYHDQLTNLITQHKVVLMTGARQVGKTTILTQFRDQRKESPSLMINCEERPLRPFETKQDMIQRFRLQYGIDICAPCLLMLDEIQVWDKVELFLKVFFDSQDIQGRLIATGSRFTGQTIAGSSLVGRGGSLQVFPLGFDEFLAIRGKTVSSLLDLRYEWVSGLVEEYRLFGGYPAVVFAGSQDQKLVVLRSIIDSWVAKDIGYFLRNEYSGACFKAMQHIALNIGNMYKEDQLCAILGLSKTVVKEMIRFLRESYVTQSVSAFFTDKTKEYSQLSELFFLDMGWLNYLRGMWGSTEYDGKLTELWVARQVIQSGLGSLHYYKKRSGSEIDFILRTYAGKLIPIEVKTSDTDLIPKSFGPFVEQYGDQVAYGLVTTRSLQMTKMLGSTPIHFVPYWMVSEWVVRHNG